jgi:hypothetical protein
MSLDIFMLTFNKNFIINTQIYNYFLISQLF